MPLTLASCHPSAKSADAHEEKVDSIVPLRYARGFEIACLPEAVRLTVFQPWGKEKEVWERYYLYENQENMPESHSDGVSVRIPLKSIALGSCTQVEFLNLLSPLSMVKGMADADKVYNEELRLALKEGRLVDLGDAFQMRMELLLQLKTDAVMLTGISQTNTQADLLKRSGQTVIFNNEWTENHLLARAEWIRFVGAFLSCQEKADSLFAETERRYQSLKCLADSLSACESAHPQILSGENFRGTWYLPGGGSYMAQLFRDAGFDYVYQADSTTGSIACPLERVLRDLNQTDVWVGVDAADLTELSAKDSRYALFKAFRQKQVYAYDARSHAGGANDFWESAVAHPDRILADFIKLHFPDYAASWKWNYLRPLHE